jgi:hypothetical protein
MLKAQGGIIFFFILLGIIVFAYLIFTGTRLEDIFKPAGPKYDNQIITVVSKIADPATPYAGTLAMLNLEIQNKGDYAVEYTEVAFTDIPGFELVDLICETGSRQGRKCVFEGENKIGIFETRAVSAVLKAAEVSTKTKVTVVYEISFKYQGFRRAQIPILPENAKDLPKGVSYSVSAPTVGPIQVEFEPPVGRTRVEKDVTIVENFARENVPFTITFTVKDIVSPKSPVVFGTGGNTIRISTDKLSVIDCNKFEISSAQQSSEYNTNLVLSQAEELPFTIQCIFKGAAVGSLAYGTGIVDAYLEYMYKNIGSQSFTILPKPE